MLLPSELSFGLQTWHDANDFSTITQSGGQVSEWRDKSPNAYHYTQATSSAQPLYQNNIFNGLPAIFFDSADFLQTADVIPFTETFTIFLVFRSEQTNRNIFQVTSPGTLYIGNGQGTANRFETFTLGKTPTGWISSNKILDNSTFYIGSVISTSANLSLFLDGNLDCQVDQAGTFSATNSFFLGGRDDGSDHLGHIAEIITYSRALSDLEHSEIISYLKAKYSMPTDIIFSPKPNVWFPFFFNTSAQTSGTSKAIPEANYLFYNNTAGIGNPVQIQNSTLEIVLNQTGSNVEVTPGAVANDFSNGIKLKPNTMYRLETSISAASVTGSSTGANVLVRLYNAANSLVQTVTLAPASVAANQAFTNYTAVFTTAATTINAFPIFQVIGNAGAATLTGTFSFRNFCLTEI